MDAPEPESAAVGESKMRLLDAMAADMSGAEAAYLASRLPAGACRSATSFQVRS